MEQARVLRINDLAQFTVTDLRRERGELALRGVFNHLIGVRIGRAWLYQESGRSLAGELVSVDEASSTADLITSESAADFGVAVGAVFPYFYGIWEPYDVDLIREDNDWRKVEYHPSAVDGIDHDECRLSHDKIGPRFQPLGYRRVQDLDRPNKQGPWLCERCYARYAIPHSMAFIYDL